MRDTVLFAGQFVMPDKDAAAIRVRGIAQALAIKGYKVVFQGDNFSTDSSCSTFEIDSQIWKTRPKYNRKEFYLDCKYLIDTIETIGKENVKAVILYHQPPISALKFNKYCVNNDIMVITDKTEWYEIYQMRQNKHAAIVIFNFYLRMLYSNRKIKNMIVISTYLKNYYKSGKNRILQIPILNINKELPAINRTWNEVRLCYCGNLAKKDLLEPVISALSALNDPRITLDIVGITQDEYVQRYHSAPEISSAIRFHGKVEHDKALQILCGCDFSLIIRRDERYAKAGFPTKMVEAFSNGVGVIATPCGDISQYVRNGENGYMVDLNSIEDNLIRIFTQLAEMQGDGIKEMKINALGTAAQYFKPEAYSDQLYDFLNEQE